MKDDKLFLTYNQQMRKLRNDKHIDCAGSIHKKILIRAGYFNIVNGYKTPFISGQDANGNHIYISGTSISQLQAVKQFDDQSQQPPVQLVVCYKPSKGLYYCSPQRAVSQAFLLVRYKAVLRESSLLDSSACSFIYFCTASSVILPIVST